MPDMNVGFNLEPPGAAAGDYTDLVTNIHGVPLGRNSAVADLSKYFGYKDKDTMGSALDEVLELAVQLNIALMSPMSFEEAMIQYLNTINPTLPNLPPIKAFLLIAERSLQQGKIGGFQLSLLNDKTLDQKNAEFVEKETDFEEDKKTKKIVERTKPEGSTKDETEEWTLTGVPNQGYGFNAWDKNFQGHHDKQTELSEENAKVIEAGRTNTLSSVTNDYFSISLGKVSGGNEWLAGNVYVTFLLEFMELQRILMKNKIVQGQVELIGMTLTVELAKTTADMIMQTARLNQMIHIVTAVMSGVAIAMSVLGMSYAMNNIKNTAALDIGSMVGQMGPMIEKMSTAITQAATDIPLAELEGLKEILQSYRQIASHQMDKAGEAFRQSEEQINQLIQTLDKIRDGLQQAIANALHK